MTTDADYLRMFARQLRDATDARDLPCKAADRIERIALAMPDAQRFLSNGDGKPDCETVAGGARVVARPSLWGELCEGCKQPIHYPTNRYMDSMFCMGDKVWHSRCVPAGGLSGTFTVSGNGGGGMQVETPASRERTAEPTTDDALNVSRPTMRPIEMLALYLDVHGTPDEIIEHAIARLKEDTAALADLSGQLADSAPKMDVQADARDAVRYRWLRAFSGHPLQVMDRNHECAYYESGLDAAIDRERMGDCDVPPEEHRP